MAQDAPGVFSEAGRSAVSRHLQSADSVPADILPMADRTARLVKKASAVEYLEALMPDRTVIVDGAGVPRQRPSKKDREKTYSGKQFTFDTVMASDKNGPVPR